VWVSGFEEGYAMGDRMTDAFIKETRAQLDRKVRENELEILSHWQGQLAKILAMKPEGVAALQMQIKKIHDMMGNRIQVLKRG